MVKNIAAAIQKLDASREIIAEKGALASRRVSENYSPEQYLEKINKVYAYALAAGG